MKLKKEYRDFCKTRQLVKKSLTEFAAAAANKVKIMFSRDRYAGKHTAQAASVLFGRQSGQMARAAACNSFVEKPRKGVFNSLPGLLQAPGQPAKEK